MIINWADVFRGGPDSIAGGGGEKAGYDARYGHRVIPVPTAPVVNSRP